MGEVVGQLELDRRRLHAADLADRLGEGARPPTGLAAEDRLQRLALGVVGAVVEVDPERRLRARPDVALELADRQDVEVVERHVAEAALADVVGEDADAMVVRRRLGELARAGDVAAADVEPIALGVPLRDVGHRASFGER